MERKPDERDPHVSDREQAWLTFLWTTGMGLGDELLHTTLQPGKSLQVYLRSERTTMGELLAEIILLWIFRYPGAFFLSLVTRKSMKHWLDHDNGYGVGMAGMLIVALVIVFAVNF